MDRQKIIVFLFFLFAIPIALQSRRKKIIPRFQTIKTAEKETPTEPEELLSKIASSPKESPSAPKTIPDVKLSTEQDVTETEEVEEEEEEPAEQNVTDSRVSPSSKDESISPDDSSPKDIYLNFENASLKAFADYISDLKKINLIPDPKIAQQKISITIRDPLTTEGAWKIFLTMLEMSGYSIIKVGDIHKIIPKSKKLTEPLPVFINTPSEKLPDSDITIRYVTTLTNIPVSQVNTLLQSMLSSPSKVFMHENINGFVITDKSYNIKAAMKVLQELDRSDVKQSVTVMRLNQANADDVKTLFDSLMEKPKGNPLARFLGRQKDTSIEYFPATKIIAEPRTNSLILLGDQKSIKKIEDFVTNHVDTTLKGIKSPIHIYELQNTDAAQIKDILDAVTQAQSDSPAARYGGIRDGVKYFKKMTIAMDKQNNRLIVSSTDNQDWKLLKKTIEDLDKPQPQVAMETMIVSVNLEKNKQLGSQFRNKKHGQLGHNMNFQAGNNAPIVFQTDSQNSPISILGNLMSTVVSTVGSTVLTFGKANNIWNVIQMLQTQTNATVLSKPFIVTTNMKEAEIKVGEKRRVVSQQAIAENSGDPGSATGYEDAEASLDVKVTPQINLDGIITLDIGIDLEEFIGDTTTAPDSTTKSLSTKVSVANGQVLVLGGFAKTKIIENIYRTPLLNKIPVLGWLFKRKSRTVTKEYIFIFMSPTIIKPRTSPGTNPYTKMKLHRAKVDIDNAITVQKTKDPIHNWFFSPGKETYSRKVVDFATARYQPTTVDIINDPYYRTKTLRQKQQEEQGTTFDDGTQPTTPEPAEKTPLIDDVEPSTEENEEEPEVSPSMEEEVTKVSSQKQNPENEGTSNSRNTRRERLKKLLSRYSPTTETANIQQSIDGRKA